MELKRCNALKSFHILWNAIHCTSQCVSSARPPMLFFSSFDLCIQWLDLWASATQFIFHLHWIYQNEHTHATQHIEANGRMKQWWESVDAVRREKLINIFISILFEYNNWNYCIRINMHILAFVICSAVFNSHLKRQDFCSLHITKQQCKQTCKDFHADSIQY